MAGDIRYNFSELTSTRMVYRFGCLILESVILVSQVSAYISNSYKGYLFTTPDNTEGNRRTQFEAATWCKNNGTRLLEIPSNEVQTIVVEYIRSIYDRGLNSWTTVLNARKYGQSWNWVNGEGINNLVVEQQGRDLTKSFGFLHSPGTRISVAAALATDRKAFICEGSSYCTAGVVFHNRCYKSHSETLSWFDARNRCLDGEGDLASFDFVNDSLGLSVLNGTWLNPASSHWIGIRRAVWKWEDSNSEVRYTHWVDGHPELNKNYDCICLYHIDWKWMTCDCGAEYQFICLTANSSISSSTTTSTKTTTTATSTKTTSPTTTRTTIANILTRPTSAAAKSTVNNLTSTSLPSSSLPADPRISHIGSGESFALTYNAALGIGLGVGIGGGLIISAIIVAIYIWARKRGWPGTFPLVKKSQSSDISLKPSGSSYALISQKRQHEANTVDNGMHAGSSNVVYSNWEYISSSTQAETSSIDNSYSKPSVIPPGESSNVEIKNGDISTVA